MSINTSFIIPHKGREDMLIETLTSIAGLTTPKEQYEVVLVSQNKPLKSYFLKTYLLLRIFLDICCHKIHL